MTSPLNPHRGNDFAEFLIEEGLMMPSESEQIEDLRDLLREIYNVTQIGGDPPAGLAQRALDWIAYLIEHKTPQP